MSLISTVGKIAAGVVAVSSAISSGTAAANDTLQQYGNQVTAPYIAPSAAGGITFPQPAAAQPARSWPTWAPIAAAGVVALLIFNRRR